MIVTPNAVTSILVYPISVQLEMLAQKTISANRDGVTQYIKHASKSLRLERDARMIMNAHLVTVEALKTVLMRVQLVITAQHTRIVQVESGATKIIRMVEQAVMTRWM